MKKTTISSVLILLLFLSACDRDWNIAKVPANTKIKGRVLSGYTEQDLYGSVYIRVDSLVSNPITSGFDNKWMGSYYKNSYRDYVYEDSTFDFDIWVEGMNFGKISLGENEHRVCINEGDELEVVFDGEEIRYSGKGSGKNNLLYMFEKQGVSGNDFESIISDYERPIEEVWEEVKSIKEKRTSVLKSNIENMKLEKEFVQAITAETEVLYGEFLMNYPKEYADYHRVSIESLALPQDFRNGDNFKNFVDDSYINSPRYIENVLNVIYDKSRNVFLSEMSGSSNELICSMILDSLPAKTAAYVLTKHIFTQFTYGVYDTVAIEKLNSIDKDKVVRKTFDYGLQEFRRHDAIGKPINEEFAETLLIDSDGNELTFGEMLGKYKGQVVYIDTWSTRCSPCVHAMPAAKLLKERLKDIPIEFVYISHDGIREGYWEKVFELTGTTENHYCEINGWDSRLNKHMGITWLPNYMIFDKEGKLVSYDAPHPTTINPDIKSKTEMYLREVVEM
jgi:thiol-disulfide isomerase/thioredoxin